MGGGRPFKEQEGERSDEDEGEESADDADFPLSLDATTAAAAARGAAAVNGGRAAAAFLHDAVPSSPPSQSQHYSREDALWDRSDALWRREMARWDQERRGWDEREAALLATVGALQREVGRLSAMLPSAAPPPPSPPLPSAAAAAAAAVASSPQHAAQAQAFVPPASAAPAPAPPPAPAALAADRSDANNGGGYAPASGVSFAEHLAAAVAAVSSGDVLEDSLGGHGELLARGAAALGLGEREEEEGKTLAAAAAAAAAAQSEAAHAPPSPPSPSSPPSPPLSAPPDLIEASDDLYWVNALQTLLDSHAMHCGDDEAEDFYFGARTRAALETFQACEGLPETGVCDGETWLKLVRGDAGKLRELQLKAPTSGEVEAAAEALREGASAAADAVQFASSASSSSAFVSVGTFSASSSSSSSHTHTHTLRVDDDGQGHLRITEEDQEEDTATVAASRAPPAAARWPVLREGDGGRPVHALQVALDRAGMSCGEEDEQWWQFGDSTQAALTTFQACGGLPESGVADERTWRALLAAAAAKGVGFAGGKRDASSFVPSDVDSLTSGDANDDDMLGNHHSGMVFLLGEQRWEKKREVS